MHKIGVGIIVLVGVIAGSWYLYSTQHEQTLLMGQKAMEQKETMEQKQMEEKTGTEGDEMMEKKDSAMMQKEDVVMKNDNTMMMSKGTYEAYAPSKLALAEKGKVVLFFHASWCPSCRALDADLKSKMDAIPAGLTILDVDYDTSTELKKKYGVTMQHTLVQVDAKGNLINKWSGGGTLESVTQNLK
jgi:thioredoxin 1